MKEPLYWRSRVDGVPVTTATDAELLAVAAGKVASTDGPELLETYRAIAAGILKGRRHL